MTRQDLKKFNRIVTFFLVAGVIAIVGFSTAVVLSLKASPPKPAMNEPQLKCKVIYNDRCYAVSTEGLTYYLNLGEWALLNLPICGDE